MRILQIFVWVRQKWYGKLPTCLSRSYINVGQNTLLAIDDALLNAINIPFQANSVLCFAEEPFTVWLRVPNVLVFAVGGMRGQISPCFFKEEWPLAVFTKHWNIAFLVVVFQISNVTMLVYLQCKKECHFCNIPPTSVFTRNPYLLIKKELPSWVGLLKPGVWRWTDP